MKSKKVVMSKARKAWCAEYERATSWEPLMDDYLAGNESFMEAANHSIQWFRDWAQETSSTIERGLPR